MTEKQSVVVVGDGWAALAILAHELGATDHSVIWIAGSGSQLLSPLPATTLEGARGWKQAAAFLGLDLGEIQAWPEGERQIPGLRFFRNKSFRPWNPADTESLPKAEKNWVTLSGARFELGFPEVERLLRNRIESYLPPEGGTRQAGKYRLRRISGASVRGLVLEDGQVTRVELSSGEQLPAQRVYACDRWSELPNWSGLPKGLPFLRKRDAYGILQATFLHDPVVAPFFAELGEGYFAAIQREAGEEAERHVWGGFHAPLDAMAGAEAHWKSTWSLCIDPEQVQDNHAIGKRLRRMKAALDKCFAGILGEERSFQSTIRDEAVRFEEEAVFSNGQPPRGTIELPHVEGVYFLTDGYGPAEAIHQAMQAQGWVPQEQAVEAEVLAAAALEPSAAESTATPSN